MMTETCGVCGEDITGLDGRGHEARDNCDIRFRAMQLNGRDQNRAFMLYHEVQLAFFAYEEKRAGALDIMRVLEEKEMEERTQKPQSNGGGVA